MSWLNDMGSWLSDRALSFVLDRYLSKYVAGGLSVDQIKSKLLNGKLDLHDINLEIDVSLHSLPNIKRIRHDSLIIGY